AGSCFFSSRRRHTRFSRDWSSDVCSSDLIQAASEAVLEYLKDAAEDFLDEQGAPISGEVPARVQWATIALVGYWVRSPDANPDEIGRASCRGRVWICGWDGSRK